MKNLIFSFLVITSFVFAEKNTAIQWLKSNEYQLLCKQIFESAKHNLDRLLEDKKFTTMLEQSDIEVEKLPVAIVSDIDETVLLNYSYHKEFISNDKPFDYKDFQEHIQNKEGIIVNGAREYFQYAAQKGVKIIFISNRIAYDENATYEKLREAGFPITDKESLLHSGEYIDWSKDKSIRREYIGKKYRVIQMFGDNLYDFAKNNQMIKCNQEKFGTSWFLLPNPIYGNWK